MLLPAVLLCLATLFGGVAVLLMPKFSPATFRLILAFTGSYLFSITLLHLLPDLFAWDTSATRVGLYVLIGFFLQLCLGSFSQGIEHGHVYEAGQEVELRSLSPLALFTSLCIHAFLDGVILSPAISVKLPHVHNPYRLLAGIILHKASEAFALVTVLRKLIRHTKTTVLYVLCFSLASPLGLWLSGYSSQQLFLPSEGLIALAAVAGGSFLHIATTIFFEASPQHHMTTPRLIATLAGAGLVVCLEYFL